ncbi:uncharacterized protein LOC129738094 [Uranotaenia lowii]|uniref:uncharacterized protein LOC129738094 n=1 Tax=Uranotaenia lowii TaxID=190385 RepID=UPI00247AC210|nr:uncharacterized protein LOC129738094 [Uranotaenia lowii]
MTEINSLLKLLIRKYNTLATRLKNSRLQSTQNGTTNRKIARNDLGAERPFDGYDGAVQQPSRPSPASKRGPEFIIESLASNIKEFCYDPDNGLVFDRWFQKYEDLFLRDGENLDDEAKVRLLLRSLSIHVHDKCRYQCFQVTKQPEEDYITYAGLVNKRCEDFELNRITADQFKSLIFICGSPKESDIRTRLLSKLESEGEGEYKLETLITECQRLHNLKSDTAMLERKQPTTASICAINKKKPLYQPASTSKEPSSVPRSPCWQCGGMHFVRDCQFSNHTCKVCNKTGHKEGYCNCFSAKPSAESRRKPKRKQKPNVNGIFATNRESWC